PGTATITATELLSGGYHATADVTVTAANSLDNAIVSEVDRLRLPGLDLANVSVAASMDGGQPHVRLTGHARLFGLDVTVSGTLNGDLTGTFTVQFGANVLNLAGFLLCTTPSGPVTMTFTITRDSDGTLTGRLTCNGSLALPDWLARVSGQA